MRLICVGILLMVSFSPAFARSPRQVEVPATILTVSQEDLRDIGVSLDLSGATGLALNPTAQVPAPGAIIAQASYFGLNGFEVGNTDFHFYGFNAAVRPGRWPVEFSVGINHLLVESEIRGIEEQIEDVSGSAGVKILLRPSISRNDAGFDLRSIIDGTSLAVGGGINDTFFGNARGYAAATTHWPAGIRTHLGFRFDHLEIDDGKSRRESDQPSVYGGLEIPLIKTTVAIPDNRTMVLGGLTLFGEMGSKSIDSARAEIPFATGVRVNSRGIPFLSDVPLLGRLFFTAGAQRTGLGDNVNLIIMITPHLAGDSGTDY